MEYRQKKKDLFYEIEKVSKKLDRRRFFGGNTKLLEEQKKALLAKFNSMTPPIRESKQYEG